MPVGRNPSALNQVGGQIVVGTGHRVIHTVFADCQEHRIRLRALHQMVCVAAVGAHAGRLVRPGFCR